MHLSELVQGVFSDIETVELIEIHAHCIHTLPELFQQLFLVGIVVGFDQCQSHQVFEWLQQRFDAGIVRFAPGVRKPDGALSHRRQCQFRRRLRRAEPQNVAHDKMPDIDHFDLDIFQIDATGDIFPVLPAEAVDQLRTLHDDAPFPVDHLPLLRHPFAPFRPVGIVVEPILQNEHLQHLFILPASHFLLLTQFS